MGEGSYESPNLMLFSEREVPIVDAKREKQDYGTGKGAEGGGSLNVVKPVH